MMTKTERSRAKWTGCRAAAAVAAVAAALAVQLSPLSARSEDAAQPGVTINYDVLNGLRARPPRSAPPAPPSLPALAQPPRSQLLIKPKRVVKAAPTADAPQPTRGRPAGLLARLAAQDAATTPAATTPAATAPAPRVPAPEVAVPLVPPPPERPEAETQETVLPALAPPPPPPVPDPVAAPPRLSDAAPDLPPPPPKQAAVDPAVEPPAASDGLRKAPSGKSKDKSKGGRKTAAQVVFEPDSTTLSETARAALAGLAAKLSESADSRITLMAYSTGEERAARRLSLSRAQAVRSFLVDKGVASTRIDVRPLGTSSAEGPADRVDVIAANR